MFEQLRRGKRALPWKVEEVPLERVKPNPYQVRGTPEPESVSALARSIARHGILQPLLGRRSADGDIEIAIGSRRLAAARLAGLAAVPIVLREFTESQMVDLSLLENLHRESLNPLETAHGLERARKEFAMRTEEDLADHLGISRELVGEAMKLLSLPPMMQKSLAEGVITPPHALLLATLPTEREQMELLEEIYRNRLSVADTIKLVNRKYRHSEESDMKEGS